MNNKYSLHIGINDYPGTNNDLAGCVNDALDMKARFEQEGYKATTLFDTDATKKNIVEALREIVAKTSWRDRAVVSYSGHGSWIPDTNGDEPDGRDEVLVPYDFQSALLSDDELYSIFRQKHFGAHITFLSDSCFSGSVARFVFVSDRATKSRYMPPEHFLSEWRLKEAKKAEAKNVPTTKPIFHRTGGKVVLISGCKDNEYSYDANFGGRPNGAFSYYALRTLSKGITVGAWYNNIRMFLPKQGQYDQTPQLTAGWYQKRWRVV